MSRRLDGPPEYYAIKIFES